MNNRLPDDFRDEIAKKQRQETQRLRKENAELRKQAQKTPGSQETGGGCFFFSGGEGELGIGPGFELASQRFDLILKGVEVVSLEIDLLDEVITELVDYCRARGLID